VVSIRSYVLLVGIGVPALVLGLTVIEGPRTDPLGTFLAAIAFGAVAWGLFAWGMMTRTFFRRRFMVPYIGLTFGLAIAFVAIGGQPDAAYASGFPLGGAVACPVVALQFWRTRVR